MTGMFVFIALMYLFLVLYISVLWFKYMELEREIDERRLAASKLRVAIDELKSQIEQNRHKFSIPFSNVETPVYRNPFATMTKITTTSTTTENKKKRRNRRRSK